jgi:hypothetical protein
MTNHVAASSNFDARLVLDWVGTEVVRRHSRRLCHHLRDGTLGAGELVKFL